MTTFANIVAYIIDADPHAKTHTLAVIEARTGKRIATQLFPTTPAGLSQAVAWIGRRTSGLADVLVAMEGVSSYGASLARCCRDAGYRVVEVFPTPVLERRDRGKSDEIDVEVDSRASPAREQFTVIPAWRSRQEDFATATSRGEAIRLA